MPVSTGRVSSREAERATRAIVCTNASAGSTTRGLGDGDGQRRESPRRAACAGERSSVRRSARRPARRCAAPSSASPPAASGRHRAAAAPAARRSRGGRPRPRAARAGRSPCRSRAARASSRPWRRSSRRRAPARRCAWRPRAWSVCSCASSSAGGKGKLHDRPLRLEEYVSRGCEHVYLASDGVIAAVGGGRSCGRMSWKSLRLGGRRCADGAHGCGSPRLVHSFSTASREASSAAMRAEVRRQA